MMNASAPCGAVIDRHLPKTGGTTVRTFLRHNANIGSCHYAGYDVSSTWKSRVGFNHVSFREIARDVPKGGKFWCVEAHVIAETFWQDLGVLRAAALPCTIVTMVRVREPYSWYKSCAPAGHQTEPSRPLSTPQVLPGEDPSPLSRWPSQTIGGRCSSGSVVACRTRLGASTSRTGCRTTCRASIFSSATRSVRDRGEALRCRDDLGGEIFAG